MATVKVKGIHGHPNDSLSVIRVDCPVCGRRQGVAQIGHVPCVCGATLDVEPFEGWQDPRPPNPDAPVSLEPIKAEEPATPETVKPEEPSAPEPTVPEPEKL